MPSRYGRPFSVAFVDIDHFKNVNDTYGHAVGDVVLRGVAQAIRTNLRATDTIGRYGGEEFMLLLTETSPTRRRSSPRSCASWSRGSGSRSMAPRPSR